MLCNHSWLQFTGSPSLRAKRSNLGALCVKYLSGWDVSNTHLAGMCQILIWLGLLRRYASRNDEARCIFAFDTEGLGTREL